MLQKILIVFFLLLNAYHSECQQGPNIIFILADDLGWGDLPAYGNRFNEAPHIDSMVKQGALYTNAYAAAPVCSPTRASILSGQYPARVGVMDFIPGLWRPYEEVITPQNRTQYLPPEIFTIGEAMKQSGYQTGYFGKWHLGDSSIYQPAQQGFNETHVGQGHYNVQLKPSYPQGKGLRLSEALAEMSESFIERNKNRPFFLFVSAFDVHLPLDADSSLIIKYLHKPKVPGYPCNAIYAAMIEHLDKMVGRIVKKVAEAGLDENTLIVFFSDNGGLDRNYKMQPLPAPGKRHLQEGDSTLYIATANIPFKGVKGNLYEGGIRVPFIARYPKKWKGGTVVNDVITSVDLYPSFLGLANGKMPASQVHDGIDIFRDKVDNNRAIFWHYPFYHHGVPASAMRLGNWKLIKNLVNNSYELYNLEKDQEENINLVKAEPARVATMAAALNKWLKEVNAPMPLPNPKFDASKRYEWGAHPSNISFGR